MKPQLLLGLLVIILLAVGAYYLYTQSTPVPGNTPAATEERNPLMNGTWKSIEDPKFTREFRSDGTITDRYEGDGRATANGTWILTDLAQEDLGIPADAFSSMTGIKITFPEGSYVFAVSSLSETTLELINVGGRGNILSFTKVN